MSNERPTEEQITEHLAAYNRAYADYWRYDRAYQDYQVSEEQRKAALTERGAALERFHAFGSWFTRHGLTLIYDPEKRAYSVVEVSHE